MAAREHKVSRRVLLGAACAAPVLSVVEGPLIRHAELDSAPTFLSPQAQGRWIPGQARNDEATASSAVTNWDRNLDRLRRTEARLKALEHTPDEDLFDEAVMVFNRALKKLVRTPAPDLSALTTKLALAVRESAWELSGGEACMAAIVRDATRFARRPD